MTIRMKALQHFAGSDGFIRRGEVFEVDEATAKRYEGHLAERVKAVEYETKVVEPKAKAAKPRARKPAQRQAAKKADTKKKEPKKG